ncbi:MAG TPA: hypothetical protein VND19_10165 [Acetobacteraceae bacterium]|nr:hypothetical protein [Acetobacteraceae bacterium]
MPPAAGNRGHQAGSRAQQPERGRFGSIRWQAIADGEVELRSTGHDLLRNVEANQTRTLPDVRVALGAGRGVQCEGAEIAGVAGEVHDVEDLALGERETVDELDRRCAAEGGRAADRKLVVLAGRGAAEFGLERAGAGLRERAGNAQCLSASKLSL